MTAPVLHKKKFWIVNPKAATNQIKNPTFAHPEFVTGWSGTNAAIAVTGDQQRRGAYSMKVTPVSGQLSRAVYSGLAVTAGLAYTFSCDVRGVAGQAMRIYIGAYTGTAFTATGYWQRIQVTTTIPSGATTTFVGVQRYSVASAEPFYVDGCQFEQDSKASTFFDGYSPGCRWEGYARNSASIRSAQYGLGGEIIDLEDYCHVVQVTGLGHGDWNQILTKMTSGGDMYQTHIRKSRQFSIIVDFIGNSLGEIESNRAAVIDLLRPDRLRGQEMVVRYQGIDVNGVEATNPVDIVCVPLPATLTDTPDLPTYQRAVLNFAIPSGLLQGAYNDGKVLDLYAKFPAEFIVKRDPQGNWCKWNGTGYDNSLKGQGTVQGLDGTVYCMAEGPDGKVYAGGRFYKAGGVTDASCLARWNPVSEEWEAVISGLAAFYVRCMAFDANGDLYIGGSFTNLGSTNGDCIVKVTDLSGTPTVNALGTGITGNDVRSIAISPNGNVYVGGDFTSAGGGGGANTAKIAKWDGTAWTPLSTGLNSAVNALAFAPNGDLYIGGRFTDAAYPYLCKWNGTAFSAVGSSTDINREVRALAFGATGYLYVGGVFTNAGGAASADYIAKWTGSKWESLGTGTNGVVWSLAVYSNKVYVGGAFTAAGGLSLADRFAVWSNGAWQPLDLDLPGTGSQYIYASFLASDGSLYIGGDYSTTVAGENAKTGIVALNFDVASASANTYPFMQIHGPGTLKAIINYRTGKSVMFDGLTLQAGEWISLNFDPLQLSFRSGWASRGNLMRYVVAGSDYGDFYVSPGANYLSIFMDDTDANSSASITYVPKFWGLDGALL